MKPFEFCIENCYLRMSQKQRAELFEFTLILTYWENYKNF